MLLRQFPDINMVRQLKNNAAPGANEWRNVVLNFECREASRLHLESPYSLFINKKGHSHCSIGKRQYLVGSDNFLFSQPGDIYGLTIDNIEKTEICNIHINRNFFHGAAHALTATHEQLLNDPHTTKTELNLFSQLYPKDTVTSLLADRLSAPETYTTNSFEVVLTDLVQHLLLQNEQIRKKIGGLPFAKASVRQDIYQRLAVARDYIYSYYNSPIDLDAICRETAMSKFHFLRVFKSFYGVTPHQYLSDVRMEKASGLLKNTGDSISEISSAIGFDYPNSFIKAFRKAYNISPLQYRKQEISNFG